MKASRCSYLLHVNPFYLPEWKCYEATQEQPFNVAPEEQTEMNGSMYLRTPRVTWTMIRFPYI